MEHDLYEQAVAYEKNNDFVNVIKIYKALCENGEIRAMLHLAYMNTYGVGMLVNYVEANRLIKIAIDMGSIDAIIILGDLNIKGLGMVSNPVEAFKLYKLASEKGHSYAMAKCGYMCEQGLGTEQNLNEAIRYYKLAIENGLYRICTDLALIYQLDEQLNFKETFHYLQLGIDNNVPSAMMELGIMYLKGNGVTEDIEKSFKLYQQAIDIYIEKNDIETLKNTFNFDDFDIYRLYEEHKLKCENKKLHQQVADLANQVTNLTNHIEASPDGRLYLLAQEDWNKKI